ncbi:MAG: hypothetical protein CSB33_04180 [Desulfobacterales bacterium]|nr:MAG: hypothetical protein CSB33_04180 [Desulfobacterales bacterium]
MYKQLTPFSTGSFAGKKLRPLKDFTFAAASYIAPVFVSEMRAAHYSYPLVFLKDPSESFGLYALLGFEQGQNLLVDENGAWEPSSHIPLALRRYPFALARKEGDAENFILCIDTGSGLVNEEEGEPLVGEDGKPAKIIEEATRFLSDVYTSEQATNAFCQEMESLGLLDAVDMKIRDAATGEKENVTGCHAVNEEKLNRLPDADFLRLKKRGALPLIYAHRFSLQYTERLLKFRSEKNNKI